MNVSSIPGMWRESTTHSTAPPTPAIKQASPQFRTCISEDFHVSSTHQVARMGLSVLGSQSLDCPVHPFLQVTLSH